MADERDGEILSALLLPLVYDVGVCGLPFSTRFQIQCTLVDGYVSALIWSLPDVVSFFISFSAASNILVVGLCIGLIHPICVEV